MKYKCENCDYTADIIQFPNLEYGSWPRFGVGDICTDKECPECYSLAYPTDDELVNLRASAPELLAALQALAEISGGGVIEKRETGKPTWYALKEIRKIAVAAISQATGEVQP